MNASPSEPVCPGGDSVVSSPAMRLLPDNRCFRLTEDAVYTWCHRTRGFEVLRLIVPTGFEHDFASVPRPLWWFVSPIDLGLASIFHDWLYRSGGRVVTWGRRPAPEGSPGAEPVPPTAADPWEEIEDPWTRRDADRLFARMMREQGVSKLRRRAAFTAVQWFGGDGWQA